jgi:hypothetical protein
MHRSCFPSFARRSVLFGKLRRALLLLLPTPGPVRVAQPSRPGLGAQRPTAWAPRARFTKPLELEKRRSARCPRVAARVQLHPPKPPPWPAGGSHCLGYHLGRLVGDRGHRKGQLRVLGSPSALHTSTKEPRTGGPPGGAGSPRTRFFLRKSLDTYLRVLKPDCGPPGPIGNILATTGGHSPEPTGHHGGKIGGATAAR